MSKNETIHVSASGAKKAGNTQRASLIPTPAWMEIANHYGVGSLKYDDNNWRKGYAWSLSYDALVRHLTAFWGGEDIDAETGSKHIIAVAWHAIALATFMDEHPELDNRFASSQTPQEAKTTWAQRFSRWTSKLSEPLLRRSPSGVRSST